MPATYEPIATTTLGSAASSITFSGIPSTYTDLRIVTVATVATTGDYWLQVNGDTGANYSQTGLYGNGSSAASLRNTNINYLYLTYVYYLTTIPQLYTVDIFSYAGSTYKTFLTTENEDNNGSGIVARTVGLWRNTAAINSIKLYRGTGNLDAGTTATLYGIKNA
jgi:hypothetical protein